MANSALVCVTVDGGEATEAGRHLPGFEYDPEIEAFRRESVWAERFAGMEQASAACPGLALTAAAIELGNMNAEAFVWLDGAVAGSYTMPMDELAETAGPDLDERAVLESLLSTVEAYAADSLTAAPRP